MKEKHTATEPPQTLTAAQVKAYLKSHPNFLIEHPEVLELLTPPSEKTGSSKVIDFQSYAMANLQEGMRGLKNQFQGLLLSARDNMSAQQQVHTAVLGLIKARDLEELLERITIDLQRLFDVDMVRLAMESEVAEFYDHYAHQGSISGISFIPLHSVNAILGAENSTLLIADTAATPFDSMDELFYDCDGLMRSVALLRLYLERLDRHMLLCFGVRKAGRFNEGQGVELLTFLAQIAEHQLGWAFSEEEIEKLR